MVIRNGMLVYPKPAFHFSLSSAHYECFPSLQRVAEEVDPWCKHSKSRYSIRPEVVSFRLIYWLQCGRFTKGRLKNRSFIIDSVMGAIRLVFVLSKRTKNVVLVQLVKKIHFKILPLLEIE
ncbi:hypothetical protein TNCT_639521 [Trichonephila clavata]|uniref:Uncharacterized protein n=1 Tax=Trichonephila clavata TaxID=2740835 RepID=A0A8X6LIR2_TRICU|nr:hypothetical protein TNCT_639521 [Trichonephila clavata]